MSLAKFNLLKSAFFISAFSTVSTLLAFGVQLILASQFGSSYQMDAYFAAVAIPQVVLRLLGMPLQQVFIPILKDLENENKKLADSFTSFIFWSLCSFFAVGAVIIFFFSNGLSHLIIPGSDAKTITFAAYLLKFLAAYTFFAGIFFVSQAIQVAYKNFSVSYFANAVSSLVIVSYTFLFIDSQGVLAAVYGLLFGAIAESIITLYKFPVPLFSRISVDKKYVLKFLKLFVPLGFGSLIYRSTPIVDRYFASFLAVGAISSLGYGLRFLESIVGFLSSGLAIVLLPISSEYSANSDKNNLSDTFSWGTRAIFLLVIPTAGYLFFFSHDLIGALFQRGNFTQELTVQVATVLQYYVGALLALALGAQMTNIFYAKKHHTTVVIINLVLLPVYFLLIKFLSTGIGIYGIALAYSVYTFITIAVYTFFLRKIIAIQWNKIGITFFQTLFSTVIMITVILVLSQLLSNNFGTLIIEIVTGGAFYIAALFLLKNEETHLMKKFLIAKFTK